eukprot:131704_1
MLTNECEGEGPNSSEYARSNKCVGMRLLKFLGQVSADIPWSRASPGAWDTMATTMTATDRTLSDEDHARLAMDFRRQSGKISKIPNKTMQTRRLASGWDSEKTWEK